MANLQQLKNKVNDLVSGLSPDKKAKLYCEDRKQYVKFVNEGEEKKAMEVLNRNNAFYKKYSFEDPQGFHEAHHKFLDWFNTYNYFQQFQTMLAEADREHKIRREGLEVLQAVLKIIKINMEMEDCNPLEELTEVLKERIDKTGKELLEYPMVIGTIEKQIEDNEDFRKHDYFRDVDFLGYKNISWENLMLQKDRITSNGGPIIPVK